MKKYFVSNLIKGDSNSRNLGDISRYGNVIIYRSENDIEYWIGTAVYAQVNNFKEALKKFNRREME